MLIKDNQIDQIVEIVQNQTGTHLSGYRKKTLFLHITERMHKLNKDAAKYVQLCSCSICECETLIHSLSVNVSSFFRIPATFEIIAQSILPELLSNTKGELRVWSAGCAAGEEVYSVAILINEALKYEIRKNTLPIIFATDINDKIINKAKSGIYGIEALKNTKLEIFNRYFTEKDNEYILSDSIKNMVNFSVEDLLSEKHIAPTESIYGSFDLILCRNVLIYFSEYTQMKVLNNLYNSLALGGFIILGHSESLSKNIKNKFRVINSENRIYQKII